MPQNNQLYDSEGRVDSPEIAFEMAKAEDPYHEKKAFGLIEPSNSSIKKGVKAAETVGQSLFAEKKKNEAEQIEVKKSTEYIPQEPLSLNVTRSRINTYVNEPKETEAQRLADEIIENLIKMSLAELPYKKEVLYAEIHGFPGLSTKDSELINGPMREYITQALTTALTEKGTTVGELDRPNAEIEGNKTLGLRVYQCHEEDSYGQDFQKNTYGYQTSKIQVYLTRNSFEY